ncbi:MAG TPA: DciA family protein [Casimicrobiaceae bacterium]|nr:DciA family protein [Casimicrobiaceae bacterium]
MKRKSSLRPLAGILTADAQLGQWVARQRQEAELAAEVRKHLPRALGLRVHVTGLRDGVLELGASGGAIAATLRQRAPALRAALSADGFGVREVKVRVQVVASASAPERGTPRSLDVRAATPLFDLAEQLPQGPLREALARWSRRARGR